MLRLAVRRRLLCPPAHAHTHTSILACVPSLQAASQRRCFFGAGEIIGVLANPAETIRQLNESRELLAKAREESSLRAEKKKIPKKHTFSRLPGFHGREAEQALLRKMLSGNPALHVVFGATSVGKTALLREVLTGDEFYVVPFDLRISGFADLRSLYVVLCEQLQLFFKEMDDEEMEKISLTFKHLLLNLLEKEAMENTAYEVSVADLADLMETLQSSLLRYWEYDPRKADEEKMDGRSEKSEEQQQPASRKIDSTIAENAKSERKSVSPNNKRKDEKEEPEKKVFQKKPIVIFMDEAHKLPALVNDQLSLKVFLDTLLVLTKQDRLCQVIFATSDAFFQHFLRSMNVGHHTQLITIGDCTKAETRSFFNDELLPAVPSELRSRLDLEEIYDAFGGKLSHISDYISAWTNSDGALTPLTSAIFTQAYTLLQFHLSHEGFATFSPLTTATAWAKQSPDSEDEIQFSRADLIYVMRKLVESPYSLPYFDLCRNIGTAQTDSMIKTRVLDLRWTKTVSPEMEWVERVWSEDRIERPIVLPMTRIVRRAMEVALREEDGRVEVERGNHKSKGGDEGRKTEPSGSAPLT